MLLVNGKAPAIARLKTASAIVLESSGDRTPEETRALLPQDAVSDRKSYDPYTLGRLNQFDDLMEKGVPAGDAETVSWAVERQGGGRGFVFTGSDFHKNMEILQHRRMLLNGILWAAKIEVPEGGASCTVPEDLLK